MHPRQEQWGALATHSRRIPYRIPNHARPSRGTGIIKSDSKPEVQVIRLYIIIATCNRLLSLQRTLQSINNAKLPSCLERILILENGSSGVAPLAAAPFRDNLPLEIWQAPVPGKSRAYQERIESLGEGLAVFLDDDVRIGPRLFEAYVHAAQVHGADGVYGGPVIPEYDRPPPDWLLSYLPRTARGWKPPDPDKDFEWFLGPNYGAFIERILSVGGFPLHLGPGTKCHLGDEMDLQARLYSDGCRRIYCTDAVVWHSVPVCRSNVRFALRRQLQEAIVEGMNKYDALQTTQTMYGMPRWLLRKTLQTALVAAFASAIPNAQTRFRLKRPYYRWRGYSAGLQYAAALRNNAKSASNAAISEKP